MRTALHSSRATRLAAGSPAYELEIWVANAMLGITFPLMVVFADFFEFWPLEAAVTTMKDGR